MAVDTIEQSTDAPEPARPVEQQPYSWRRALVWSAVAYVLSRAAVLAGAGAAAASESPRPTSRRRSDPRRLTSWDGSGTSRSCATATPGTCRRTSPSTSSRPGRPSSRSTRGRSGLLDKVLPGRRRLRRAGPQPRPRRGVRPPRRGHDPPALRQQGGGAGHGAHRAVPRELRAQLRLQRSADARARRRLPAPADGPALGAGRARRRAGHGEPPERHRPHRRLRRRRDRRHRRSGGSGRRSLAPLLAPLGWIAFQLFLAHQTGERGVWFRVQREAWDEGTSFGLTAIKDIGNAFVHPLDSPREHPHAALRGRHARRALGAVEAAAPAARSPSTPSGSWRSCCCPRPSPRGPASSSPPSRS